MSDTTTEQLPATAQLARQFHDELTLMARALLHAVGETDDQEAMDYLRRRALAARPSEAMRKITENRERQQIEAANRMAQPFDAHADTRAAREKFYAGLPRWDGV